MNGEDPKPPQKARVREAKDHVAARLEPELVGKVDAAVVELTTAWHEANRSDALRMLIIKGLHPYKEEKTQHGPTGDPDPTT
jgi:hypothetical protein